MPLISWSTFGALSAGAAMMADHLMFKGLPGPINSRMTIPMTNRYIFYNAGLRMQLTHSLALMAIPPTSPVINLVGVMFAAGMTVYSGACYAYCWNGQEVLKKVQPIGNFILLAGWLLLATNMFRKSSL